VKKSTVVSLLIGRSGSTLGDKNILPVLGAPLLHYPAAAARRSVYIGRYYCSSDCPKILALAQQAGFTPIARPAELSTSTAQSSDVVDHALDVVGAEGECDVLVVQHANVGTTSEAQIDEAISLLLANPDTTAVVPVHRMPEYHPYRGFSVKENVMEPLAPPGVSGNRQELPDVVFPDHSFWVINVKAVKRFGRSKGPWPCMGSRIMPLVGEGCFDVHSISDLKRTEEWILQNKIPAPNFS